MALTIERFVEIVYPLKYKAHFTRKKAVLAIGVVWLLFITWQQATVAHASRVHPNGKTCILHSNYQSVAVQKLVGTLVYVIIQVAPVVVMTFCYARMWRAVRQTQPQLSIISAMERARHLQQQRIRRNLIKTLITVAVAYVLCVSWNQTYFYLVNLGVSLPYNTPFYHFTVYALFTNCIINPFIYTARYREFRKSVRHMLTCLTGKSTVTPASTQQSSDQQTGSRG